MKQVFVERRKAIAVGSLLVGLLNIAAYAFVPADFTRDQLPWMFAVGPMFLVGALLINRVPANPIGWVLLVMAVTGSFGTYQGFGSLDGWPSAVGAGLSTLGLSLLPGVLLVFPTGSPPSSRWRPAVVLIGAIAVLGGVNGFLTGGWGGEPAEDAALSPLYESTRSFTEVSVEVFFPLFALCYATAFASLLVRYRRGTTEVRHQLKWLLTGAGFMVVAIVLVVVVFGAGSGNEGWAAIPLAIGIGSVPVSIGIAVLRYRLYDIDVILSKSVMYLGLLAAITAVYAAVVVVPLLVIGRSDGDGPGLLLPIVATGVVALLFEPIRSRMQRWADRVVYGDWATPHEVLSSITARVADADGHSADELARIVAEGTGADRAAVWIEAGGELESVGRWPSEGPRMERPDVDDDQNAIVRVHHETELLGAVSITKPGNDPIAPADRELLDDVAAGAGLLLRNIRLNRDLQVRAEEVRSSRRRLIEAQDRERHRLERDLHDGAQQQVVALKVKLGIARTVAGREGSDEIAERLSGLADETQAAVDALRGVAHGIYPPLLESEGLEPALRAVERSWPLPLELDATGLERYGRSTEATAYFCVTETLERARMGGATGARVGIEGRNGDLVTEIDLGRLEAELDLSSVADRIDAAGGTLTIEYKPERGRCVVSSLPIAHREGANT